MYVVCQLGDVGSTLVVGEAGRDRSTMLLSKMELRGLDCGEVGAEDGANSDGESDMSDHRLSEGMEIVELDCFGEW